MNAKQIEDQIQALLKEAEPLRLIPEDDDDAREPLRHIIDRINALRAKQALAKDAEALQGLMQPEERESPAPAVDMRSQLEAEAKELGIAFNARTPDAKLAERIEEAKKA